MCICQSQPPNLPLSRIYLNDIGDFLVSQTVKNLRNAGDLGLISEYFLHILKASTFPCHSTVIKFRTFNANKKSCLIYSAYLTNFTNKILFRDISPKLRSIPKIT